MERHQVFVGSVGELVDLLPIDRGDRASAQRFFSLQATSLISLPDALEGSGSQSALIHSRHVERVGVVVNRAGLSGLPAENQQVESGSSAEQLALVGAIAEGNVPFKKLVAEVEICHPIPQLL